jgi:hypothetical protein
MVTLPLEIVTLASVMLLSVLTVFPSWIAVLPNVMVVAKFWSSCESGIELVAPAKVYGTAMSEPHSQFVFHLKRIDYKPRVAASERQTKVFAILLSI